MISAASWLRSSSSTASQSCKPEVWLTPLDERGSGLVPSLIVLDLVTAPTDGWVFIARRRRESGLARSVPLVLYVDTRTGPVVELHLAAVIDTQIDADELASIATRLIDRPDKI